MAEATDHPQVPPDAIMSEEQLSARPAASFETYQPLSLLALAGFGLAVVYALAVLVGGAISLFGRIPWLMPYWTFLLPIAILVVCWAARTRILASEGTLSGLAFTTWGSRLAILFGITYAAYYFATFLAVRGPAIDCANDFLQKIKDGQLDQAFAQAQDPPIKTKNKEAMRDEIERRFNRPTGGMMVQPGMFSNYRQQHFVRYIQMDGDKAKTTPAGVDVWEFGKDRYRVVLTYHVATSLVEFDLRVETSGRDPKPGEQKGRQWQVRLQSSETGIVTGSMRYTEKGREFVTKMMSAQKFATEWGAKASDVDALKPEQRESYAKLIRGYDTFWSSQQLREDITQYIRKTFQKKSSITFQPNGIPFMRESDGRTTALIDLLLRYSEEGTMIPIYVVEGRLVLSADSNAAFDSSAAWRIDALEIESAQTAPQRERMQKSMGTPTPEEGGPNKGRTRTKPPSASELPGIPPGKP